MNSRVVYSQYRQRIAVSGWLLADIFVHDNGCGNADIETFHTAKLGDSQAAYLGVIIPVKADTKSLVTQNESTLCRQARLVECGTAAGLQGKQGVTLLTQLVMTGLKAFMEVCRDLAEGALRGGGIKGVHIDQMDLPRAKGFRTAKDFRDIKACLEVIQHQDEIMHARLCSLIAPLLLLESQQGVFASIMAFFTFLTADHGLIIPVKS